MRLLGGHSWAVLSDDLSQRRYRYVWPIAARVEKLVTKTGDAGLTDEEMIRVLDDAVEALDEGLS